MSRSKQGDLFGGAAPAPKADVAAPKSVVAPVALPPVEPSRTPAWRKPVEPKAEATVLTVSELTRQVKGALEPQFTRVLVRGEVANFRGANARGHLYFALKDEGASIDVKLWAGSAQRLKFQLKEGLSVIIEGNLDVYAPQGRYSLIVNRIDPEGVGAQALAFEQLKQKLVAEGLIGDQRTRPRRPLPFLPRRIGVVTSVTGAALRDFVKVLHRRHPRLSVLVADARVQGDGAVGDVCRALRWLGRTDVDVIVVTRGGGSAEDLWTFNEEQVVRAVWACPVPVVSAVGHEIDTTLCDLVADVRAPTPSAAAELLAPMLVDLEAQLATIKSQLHRAMEKTLLQERSELRAMRGALGDPRRALTTQRLFISGAAERLTTILRKRARTEGVALRDLSQRLQRARPQAQLQARKAALVGLRSSLLALGQRRLRGERERFFQLSRELERHSPRPLLQQGQQLLARQDERLGAALKARLQREREALRGLAAQLDAYSPLKVLSRGYALVQGPDGQVVRRAAQVAVGDQLRLRLGGGDEVSATVTQVKGR